MKNVNPRLANLVSLIQEKCAVEERLNVLNAKITAAIGKNSTSSKAAKGKTVVVKSRSGRADLKGLITDFLKSAKGATVSVKELTYELGLKINQSTFGLIPPAKRLPKSRRWELVLLLGLPRL